MPSISALILTRNNERTIGSCLDSILSAVDHVIVVDTGSTDNTVSIVRSRGAEVHHFEWQDDFSVARNFALSKATTEWVINVDSDEILYPEDVDNIREVAQAFDQRPDVLLAIQQMNRKGPQVVAAPVGRMFHNNGRCRWVRRIHEYVVTEDGQDCPIHGVPVRVLHDGYDKNQTDVLSKLNRNIAILELERTQNPDDPLTEFYLGREKSFGGYPPQDIVHHLLRANGLLGQHTKLNFAQNIKSLLTMTLVQLGRLEEANSVVQSMTEDFPDFPDTVYWKVAVTVMRSANDLHSMIGEVGRAKQLSLNYQGTTYHDDTIGTWKADLALADIMRLTGNLVDARRLYQQALPYYPVGENFIRAIDQQTLQLQPYLITHCDQNTRA